MQCGSKDTLARWESIGRRGPRLISLAQVLSSGRGSIQLTLKEFISEVTSFHTRLMEQMSARVMEVLAGALPDSVQVDLVELTCEHQHRSHDDISRRTAPTKTDWGLVRGALAKIEHNSNH
jgi:hypothetical protein